MRKTYDEEDENFENGILKDKHTYKVPLRFCDAVSQAAAKHATKQRIVDQTGSAGLALLRPGARFLQGGSARVQEAWQKITRDAADAYALDEHFKQNAWRDAILDESDEDAVYEAKKEAQSTDAYLEYQAQIKDEWKHGNE
jgi:hypothetical protein